MMKRRVLVRSAMVVMAVLMATVVDSAQAKPTISKTLADYQYYPYHGERCSSCCMFIPGSPDRCTMIEGIIDPSGWCKYYKQGSADTCS